MLLVSLPHESYQKRRMEMSPRRRFHGPAMDQLKMYTKFSAEFGNAALFSSIAFHHISNRIPMFMDKILPHVHGLNILKSWRIRPKHRPLKSSRPAIPLHAAAPTSSGAVESRSVASWLPPRILGRTSQGRMDHKGFEVSRSGNPMVLIMEKSDVKIWTNDVFFGISPNFSNHQWR